MSRIESSCHRPLSTTLAHLLPIADAPLPLLARSLAEGDTGIYVGQCLDADGRNKGHVQDAKRHPDRKSSQAANPAKDSRTIPYIRISATSWFAALLDVAFPELRALLSRLLGYPATDRQMVQAFLLAVEALIRGALRACRGQLRYNNVLDEFLPEIDSSIVGLNGNACLGSGLVDDSGLFPSTSLYAGPLTPAAPAPAATAATSITTTSRGASVGSSSSSTLPQPPQ